MEVDRAKIAARRGGDNVNVTACGTASAAVAEVIASDAGEPRSAGGSGAARTHNHVGARTSAGAGAHAQDARDADEAHARKFQQDQDLAGRAAAIVSRDADEAAHARRLQQEQDLAAAADTGRGGRRPRHAAADDRDRETRAAAAHYLAPRPLPVWMRDPRADTAAETAVIAFYHPGRDLPWDVACGGGFLGNFWSCRVEFAPRASRGGGGVVFTNAEAAFQACKWWGKACRFAQLDGEGAFRLKGSPACRGSEDWTYSGHGLGADGRRGANWRAMRGVLSAKFARGSALADALRRTGDAFLLEHNEKAGRDHVWSDNQRGDGLNWLGLQLMLVRDALAAVDRAAAADTAVGDDGRRWARFIEACVDVETGEPLDPAGTARWQAAVRAATCATAEAMRMM